MRRRYIGSLGVLLALTLILPPAVVSGPQLPPSLTSAVPARSVVADVDFGQMPVYFVENRGQLDGFAGYYVQGSDKTLYFTAEGVTFSLAGRRNDSPGWGPERTGWGPEKTGWGPENEGFPSLTAYAAARSRRWVVKLDFLDARGVQPEGADRLEAVVSYFKGRPEAWHTGLPAYGGLVYYDLWPGIDLVYRGTTDRLKYEFVVHPGADPGDIGLAYRGASSVGLNASGQLEVETPQGGFVDEMPVAYQTVDGERIAVPVVYDVSQEEARTRFGFSLGEFDPNRTLVIDPTVLIYCGFIGGGDDEHGHDIAVDGSGNAYVVGSTYSSQASFPVNTGPDVTHNGGPDAFVAKVQADGLALVYAGYIGGSGLDEGYDIAVDSLGQAYVTGSTSSTESTFPVIEGPDLTYNGGDYDAFVAKVDENGTALTYCGYIGGAVKDHGRGIAVDDSGQAYVAGSTDSLDGSFPVAVGPDLGHNGSNDAFVSKVHATGTSLVYSGFIGGASTDLGADIAVDSGGQAYVTGSTGSTESSFPAYVGPDLTYNGGLYDCFVARVTASGNGLGYAGYIGGSGTDECRGVDVDGAGRAYVVGETESTESTFPVVGGPDLSYNGGFRDAFVARVLESGIGLNLCGYVGGEGSDRGWCIAVDAAGQVHVGGETDSTEDTFPTIEGPDQTQNGYTDAFVSKLDATGTSFHYSGFVGGALPDYIYGIALDGAGQAYVAGSTWSDQDSFPVVGGPALVARGGREAFVAKIGTEAGQTSTISGFIDDDGGIPMMEIEVRATGGRTTSTDFVGYYEFENLQAGTYTLTPFRVGYSFSPPSLSVTVPPDATHQNFVGREAPLRVKYLFVPLRWPGSQQAFDSEVETQADFFLADIPLKSCRNQVLLQTLNVTTQNFGTFTCSKTDSGEEKIKAFVRDQLGIDIADYDVIVGLAETSPCPPYMGSSNNTDTLWIQGEHDPTLAHELGHIYGLEDQYCSNQAGSTDKRCNDGDPEGDGSATGDKNYLDATEPQDCPPDGSNDSNGLKCCNWDQAHQCSTKDYGVCCRGNFNQHGGRSTMSYANAPGTRGFDAHDLAHLSARPELQCSPPVELRPGVKSAPQADGDQALIDASLMVGQDDSVVEDSIALTEGRPTPASVLEQLSGDYALEITDRTGATMWSQDFALHFDYFGPVTGDGDYSDTSYDARNVSLRIPYVEGMSILKLYHDATLIFSKMVVDTRGKVYLPLILRRQ